MIRSTFVWGMGYVQGSGEVIACLLGPIMPLCSGLDFGIESCLLGLAMYVCGLHAMPCYVRPLLTAYTRTCASIA